MSSINDIVRKLRENRILQERKDYSKYSREDLIKMAQDGDQLAFDVLLKSHKDFLGKMTYKYFSSNSDKDDINQIAQIGFWEAIQRWNGEGDFEAFAGMIIKRKITDELRKSDTGKALINTNADSFDRVVQHKSTGKGEGSHEVTLGDITPSKSTSLEDEVIGNQSAKDLMKFMEDNFSEKELEVVRRYIKGYKIPQIAEEMGMKYKSVENALMRLRGKLNDYRNRESKEYKKLKESGDIEFTDEEKTLLTNVLNKIKESNSLKEDTSPDIIEDRLSQIEDRMDEIIYALEDIDYDEDARDEYIDELDQLISEILRLEDDMTEEQYDRADKLATKLERAKDTEYGGKYKPRDPYTDRGLKKSDFY